MLALMLNIIIFDQIEHNYMNEMAEFPVPEIFKLTKTKTY